MLLNKLMLKCLRKPGVLLFCLISNFIVMAQANSEEVVVSKENPRSVAYNEKGAAAAQAQDLAGAIKYFRQALVADSSNLTAVFNLASVYLQKKEIDKSIELLKRYARPEIADAGIYLRLGDAYFSKKDLKQALNAYEKAYSIDPATATLSEKLGSVYTLLDRLNDAEKVLLKAVELDPKDGQILANLSSVFLANGKFSKAISTAKRALQLNVTSDLYVTLGTAYELSNDYKNALIAMQRASDLGDNRSELSDKIEELKKMTS